jgi:hypothetical protein
MSAAKNKLIARERKQTAVYWGNARSDGRGGFTLDSPVEIEVRWEDRQDKVTIGGGKEITSSARVAVDRDLTKGTAGWGFLFLGALTDLPSAQDPTRMAEAREIMDYRNQKTLRGNQTYRIAYLGGRGVGF